MHYRKSYLKVNAELSAETLTFVCGNFWEKKNYQEIGHRTIVRIPQKRKPDGLQQLERCYSSFITKQSDYDENRGSSEHNPSERTSGV